MAWSTRQVAELAGTTVKAVRHYHKLGLLDHPARDTNGYKQYGVDHLRRLLRIRRLTELGVPLSQIAALGDADEHPADALRLLDDDLAASIERLQRVRAELAVILRQELPTDLPAELAPATEQLTGADRAMMVVLSRVLDSAGVDAYRRMLTAYRKRPEGTEFDELAADADETVREDLARRLLPQVIALHRRHPDLVRAQHDAPGGPEFAAQTIGLAMNDLYNVAQLDVLKRLGQHLRRRSAEQVRTDGP